MKAQRQVVGWGFRAALPLLAWCAVQLGAPAHYIVVPLVAFGVADGRLTVAFGVAVVLLAGAFLPNAPIVAPVRALLWLLEWCTHALLFVAAPVASVAEVIGALKTALWADKRWDSAWARLAVSVTVVWVAVGLWVALVVLAATSFVTPLAHLLMFVSVAVAGLLARRAVGAAVVIFASVTFLLIAATREHVILRVLSMAVGPAVAITPSLGGPWLPLVSTLLTLAPPGSWLRAAQPVWLLLLFGAMLFVPRLVLWDTLFGANAVSGDDDDNDEHA